MTKYAAFLRGIMPSNPNMRNEKLRQVFERLGFSNVKTVISSGNVIFESPAKSTVKLEADIEKALLKELQIQSPAFIRSQKELDSLLKKEPFKKVAHSRETYQLVTFLRKKPHQIFTTINVIENEASRFMVDLEKKYGKDLTSRTWKTVERIAAKF